MLHACKAVRHLGINSLPSVHLSVITWFIFWGIDFKIATHISSDQENGTILPFPTYNKSAADDFENKHEKKLESTFK